MTSREWLCALTGYMLGISTILTIYNLRSLRSIFYKLKRIELNNLWRK